MPAAAMQLTVLVFAVALCTAPSFEADPLSTSTAVPVTSTNHASLSTGTSIHASTSTHQNTSAVPPDSVSFTSQTPPTPSVPAQTDNRTEEMSPSPPAQNMTTTFTSNQTVSSGPSVQATTNVTGNTTVKATSAGLPHDQGEGDLAANPGLLAVICIFCIIFALVLVVGLIKCTKSPRSNFERLEDVPMGKVSENSPFAQYSK